MTFKSIFVKKDNMENTTQYIAIYAAIISTFALTWNIIQYVRGRKGKIKITPTINTKFPVSDTRNVLSHFSSLDISIVNLSEQSRFVKQPQFELNQKADRYMNLLCLDNPIEYPLELKPGQEFTTWFNLDLLNKQDLKKITADKFRIIILDTHGKEYKSKWYSTIDFQLNSKRV